MENNAGSRYGQAMKALALPFLLVAGPAAAQDLAGRYRLSEGPDVAATLELRADGRFGYELAAGALDERAVGKWEEVVGRACLTTEPTPVPPVLAAVPVPADQSATLLVTWPNGRGIAGVDFTIGFDIGPPRQGYTQADGWKLPEDERRMPRWIELSEGISRVRLPRAEVTRGKFRAVLTPNDLGVVDFQGACLEREGEFYVLRRRDGAMRFRRAVR